MKRLFFWLVLVGFFILLPDKAQAWEKKGISGEQNQAFKDYKFDVTAYNNEPNPPDFIKDTSDIIINITAKDSSGKPGNAFETGGFWNQYYVFFQKTDNSLRCDRGQPVPIDGEGFYIGPWTARATSYNSSTKTLSFTVPITPFLQCTLSPGTYTLDIKSLGHSTYSKTALVLKIPGFGITPPGGGKATELKQLGRKDGYFCKDETQDFLVNNTEVGKKYHVFWEVDPNKFFWSKPVLDTSFVVQVMKSVGRSFRLGNQYKLCVSEGDDISVCRYSLSLQYTEDPNICKKDTKQITCNAIVSTTELATSKKRATIIGENFPSDASFYRGDLISDSKPDEQPKRFSNLSRSDQGTVIVNTGEMSPGDYTFNFYRQNTSSSEGTNSLICHTRFTVDNKVETGNKGPDQMLRSTECSKDGSGGKPRCIGSSGLSCNTASGKGVLTAIGCVPTDSNALIAGLMRYITGFSGGVALLLMVFGSFQMITSAGNADNLKKGREQFVSAIIGLLFIIFATLLMQIIGVDILGLPGFKK